MIGPECYACERELSRFGAILLGPPDACDTVKKHHLCVACYESVMASLEKSWTSKFRARLRRR